MIETKIEADGIEEIRARLGDLQYKAPSVLARAINRTTTNIKKNMAEQAASRYRVKNTDVKATIDMSNATGSKPEGRVISKGAVIALSKFKVTPNRPVTYPRGKPSPRVYAASVKKGGVLRKLDGDPKAFIAVMKSGHKGVYERTGKWETTNDRAKTRTREYNRKGKQKAHSRHNEIIRQRYGPSVPQMIQNKESMAHIQEEARSTLQKRIDAEIAHILGERGAQ